MRRGGSRYVREDATSSVQLARVMHGTGRHIAASASRARCSRGPEIICPPENNRVAQGRQPAERRAPYRLSTGSAYLLTYLCPRKQRRAEERERERGTSEHRHYLALPDNLSRFCVARRLGRRLIGQSSSPEIRDFGIFLCIFLSILYSTSILLSLLHQLCSFSPKRHREVREKRHAIQKLSGHLAKVSRAYKAVGYHGTRCQGHRRDV